MGSPFSVFRNGFRAALYAGSPPAQAPPGGRVVSPQPEQLLRIAEGYLLARLCRHLDRFQHLDGVADIARASFRIEGRVRREQHLIGGIEVQAAYGRGARTEHRGVGVEILEIVERTLL